METLLTVAQHIPMESIYVDNDKKNEQVMLTLAQSTWHKNTAFERDKTGNN